MAAVGVGMLGAAWYVATDRAWIDMRSPRETGVGVVWWGTPDGAARFVLEAGLPRNVFNTLRDGGYLVWKSGATLPVFVDGRTDVYPEEFLRETSKTGPGNWAQIAQKWGIRTAIIPSSGWEGLAAALGRKGSGWAPVFLDQHNVVFVKEEPETAALVAKYRIDPAAEWSPRGPEPDERPEAWKRVIGGRGRGWYCQGMADSLLAIGSYRGAMRYLERGLARWPRDEMMAATLAALDGAFGKEAEARELYGRLRSGVWRAYSDRYLAGLLAEAGKKEASAAAMERAVRSAPEDPSLRLPLGDYYFQAGDFARAAEQYRVLLKLGGGGAEEWKKLGYACEKTGNLAAAAEGYRESLKLNPGQAPLENQLGMVLGRMGDREGAAAAFGRALRIRPDYRAARENLEAVRGGGR